MQSCLELNPSLLHNTFWNITLRTAYAEFNLGKVRYLKNTIFFIIIDGIHSS